MPRNRRDIWERLVDVRSFPDWLVGARRVVRVDSSWPREGSVFEHRIGAMGLRIPGSTTVEECVPGARLVLRAGMGLMGEMRVAFDLHDVAPGSTRLVVSEGPTRGPVRWLARLMPHLLSAVLWGRNSISLDRLRARLLSSDAV